MTTLMSGTSCDAINIMHNASISVYYKTIKNYKKKIINAHPENIQKYFAKKVSKLTLLTIRIIAFLYIILMIITIYIE